MQQDAKNIEEARHELNIDKLDLILCPINDCRDGNQADAGTHWTLLVCSSFSPCQTSNEEAKCPVWQFCHYDTLRFSLAGDANLQQAETLASRLVGRPVRIN